MERCTSGGHCLSTHPGAFLIGGDPVDFQHIRVINKIVEKEEVDHDVATELMEMYISQGMTLAEVIRQHQLDMEN